jgi:hypothetical protein
VDAAVNVRAASMTFPAGAAMLYISLGASIVLFVVTLNAVSVSRDRRKTYLKVWLGLLYGIVPCLCVLLPAYLLHALLLGIVATACRWAGAGTGPFACGSLAAFLISYGAIGVPRAVGLWQAARQYPFESLEPQLAYETQRPVRSFRAPEPKSDGPVEIGFDESLIWSQGRRRERVLRELHEDCLRLFMNAPGFGFVRMVGPDLSDITRGETIRNAAPVSLPQPPEPGESLALSSGDLVLDPPIDAPATTTMLGSVSLRTFHRGSIAEFANPLGFGYVRDRGHVAGFVSHRFTQYPPNPTKPQGNGHWRIESLDLISLLKHPEPVAYVSKHLPRMDELRDAPTRPLDEFESERLPKLLAGEEFSAAQAPRRVRMLGAIRARAECLKCHSVDQGDLLGAFSYDLRRDLPLPR